jgi:predicted MPP superfamily phosphohydrolase
MSHVRIGALTIVGLAALLAIASRAQLTRIQPVGGSSHLGLLLTDIHLDPVTVNPRNPKFSDSDAIRLLEKTKIDDWPAQFAKFQKNIARPKSKPPVDANYPLVDAALKAAADKTLVAGSFDYVVFTGDMLRHDFPRADSQEQALARNTAAFVVRELSRRFNVPVFAALGNNDSDSCDYGVKPNDQFLGAVAGEMTVLKANTLESKAANAEFRKGGYFILPHPTVANQDILVLNSNFWSKKYLIAYCGVPYTEAPGLDEMSWLDGKLRLAAQNHRGVTLVMHIPPGVDPYSSQPGSADSLFWTKKFNDMFAAEIAKYRPVIPIAFAGHSHLDDFRSFDKVPSVPWHIGLAVSPVFENNPGFSTFSYDPKTAAITDITTFTAASGSASFTREYGFNDAYRVNGFSAANLDAINSGLRTCKTNCADTTAFESYYMPGSSWGGTLKNIACSQKYFSAADVKECISK